MESPLSMSSPTESRIERALLLVVTLLLSGTLAAFAPLPAQTEHNLGDVGAFPEWSKVEISFAGPNSQALNTDANPFKITVDVVFVAPNRQAFVVPAFYDGDGNGGLDGNVWRVRFSPNMAGAWSFASISSDSLLSGYTGTFAVTHSSDCAAYTPGGLPNFDCAGRLRYIEGEHYWRFADGTYWLKGGANEPEDFLAPEQNVGFASKTEAMDYLAQLGVNSLYILLDNVGGDHNNVWPWIGSTAGEARANDEHFDVAKLVEWESIFTQLQDRGIVLHLVLEDDSAWTGFNREMYYREMVARFSHHNGLFWNISEEYNESYSPDEIKAFADMLLMFDPYNHPVTVHHMESTSNWEPFVGDSRFQATSLQTGPTPQNRAAINWRQIVADSGHTIPISFDETGLIAASDRELARHILWSVYLGGATFELHSSPMTSYREFAELFGDMHIARTLIEQWPYWQMEPENEVLTSGSGYVLGEAGEVYIIYLPEGGGAEIELPSDGTFEVNWYRPDTGDQIAGNPVTGPGRQSLGEPPSDTTQDWVIIVNKLSSG